MPKQEKTMHDKSDDTKCVTGESGKALQWPKPPVGRYYIRCKLASEEDFEKELAKALNDC